MHSQFLFVEFAEGQPVEVLRPGTFVDRNGRTVEVTLQDLEAFVTAFEAGATGQEVPIDIQHERAEAAGWIKRLYRDGNRLLALPDWNELGQRLVKERIYRYLSATIDMAQKVIKSVSLVNFPAVKGLKPVELSEGIYTLQADNGWFEGLVMRIAAVIREALGTTSEPEEETPPVEEAEFVIRKEGNKIILYSSDGEKVLGRFPFGEGEEYGSEEAAREAATKREREIQHFKHEGGEAETTDQTELQGNIQSMLIPEEDTDMNEEQLKELREQIRNEVLAELEQEETHLAELREEVRKEVEVELQERFERRKGLVEFVEGLCGGDDAALSAKPEDVVEFLEGLEGDQLEQAKTLLQSKVVDLSERGSSREGKRNGRKELPKEVQMALDGGDLTVADLGNQILDLGDLEQYDLSKWE